MSQVCLPTVLTLSVKAAGLSLTVLTLSWTARLCSSNLNIVGNSQVCLPTVLTLTLIARFTFLTHVVSLLARAAKRRAAPLLRMVKVAALFVYKISRVYMRSAYQKSETYWLLGPFPWGGVDHRTVAQLSRAVKPRTALRKKAAQYVQERRTVLGICGNKLKC